MEEKILTFKYTNKTCTLWLSKLNNEAGHGGHTHMAVLLIGEESDGKLIDEFYSTPERVKAFTVEQCEAYTKAWLEHEDDQPFPPIISEMACFG